MTRISDEAVAAVAKRLYRWSTEQGQSYAYQNVRAALQAAHLTDDGAAAPGGAPGNASAFGPSTGATPTAAPSSPTSEYSDLEYATRLDGTTMPAPKVLPNEFCWCGGEVGSRSPGDHLGLGCLADVKHNWNAASQEGQRVIELSAVLSVHQPYIDRYGNYTTCKCGATCKWSGDHQASALLAVSEGATPAIDRATIMLALYEDGAYCGDCDYEGAYFTADGFSVNCSACSRVLGKYADTILALVGGAS